MSWRTYAEKGVWLDPETVEAEMVEELVQYMAFCFAVKRNKEATVAGKLVEVKFYREQWGGLSLPINHVRVRAVRQGIKRAHVESGSQQRLRRPLTRRMLAGMEAGSQEWGVRGRVL